MEALDTINKEEEIKAKVIALFKQYKILKTLSPGQVCDAVGIFDDEVMLEQFLKKTNDYRIILILGVFVGNLEFAKIACRRALNEEHGNEYAQELICEIMKFSIFEEPLWDYVLRI